LDERRIRKWGAVSRTDVATIQSADIVIFVLDVAAALAFGAALALLAFAGGPLQTQALVAHLALAVALIAAFLSHNLLGRRPLYWSHFDFLAAMFGAFLAATLYYSQARAVTATALAWSIDGVWAYLLGRYLFFRRLRLFNLVALALCAGIWLATETLLGRLPGDVASAPATLHLQAMRGLAFSVGLVLLLAQPFFLLRKPATIVFVIWSAALLGGISLWAVQALLDTLDAWQAGALTSWSFEQGLLLKTATRVFVAYPITGGGAGTWPWLSGAFRPLGYVDLPPVVPALLRATCEWGAVGLILLLVAWLRVPLFVMRRWALFPNRRLRMSVLVFLSLVLLGAGRWVLTDDLSEPWGWALWWGIFGTFVSLVAVRDPLRIFYEPITLAGRPTHDTAAPRRWVRHAVHSALRTGDSRTGGAAMSTLGVVLRMIVPACLILVLAVAQTIPGAAVLLIQPRTGESLGAIEYGRRIERAVALFPYYSDGWARLAQHYQERAAGDPLARLALAPAIEAAYRRAIDANPYEPNYYEQLAFFYTDMNAPTRALETLRTGVANNPNHFVTRLLLVRELERAQSYALATWHLRQALLRIAPQQAELFVRLAELYELRGMRADAIRSCQYARQGLPDSASALLRLRRVAERLGIARKLI
jgi:hypothetical protein